MNKNKKILESFVAHCEAHPEQRFWQALRNWSGVAFIHADAVDTFYWRGKGQIK